MNDCGGCKFCLDKRKFGGPGKLKKRCELRVCMTPRKIGAPSTAPSTKPMAQSNGYKMQLEVKNKFLTNIDNRAPIKIVESPQVQAENRVALENIIEMGLETFEVVNVVNMPEAQQLDKNCYICKKTNKEDLFYCSSCCEPFHQFCLSVELGGGGSTQSVSTSCGQCQGKGDFEQAMNARAESIHAKCEEINGAQYQVISFLTHADQLKMPDMILQVEDDEEEEEKEKKKSLARQQANQLPGQYDNDFDAYLHTIGLAK